MNKYDTVIIQSTKEVCTIQRVETTSMGRSVYYLDSKEFVSEYPFYEQDLKLVDEELLHNGYNEYLDEERSMRNVLEECDRIENFENDIDPKTIEKVMEEHRETLDALASHDIFTGIKFDVGKIRHSLLVPEFIEDVLKVLELGASKYGDFNWKGLEKRRVEDALYRHYLQYLKGETKDSESGISHMAHVACNAMMIFWIVRKENEEK